MNRISLVILLCGVLFLTACGGGGIGSGPKPPSGGGSVQPLDPQGNWLFTFTADGVTVLEFAGQLYELAPPIVTANSMGTAPFGYHCGGMKPEGQASGTDTITMTVTAVDSKDIKPIQITGTIAPDQEHMSGTWTGGQGCTPVSSGTWAARLLTPVDGTWTGTGDNGLQLSVTMKENTDQTSRDMGKVSGSITVTGGGCFSGPVNLSSDFGANMHGGETLLLGSVPDAITGAVISNEFNAMLNVDPDATKARYMTFNIVGGPCDGQRFTADLTKN